MSQEAITLYVAENGNDEWSGAEPVPTADGSDGPLASLAAARDAVRRMKAQGELTRPVQVLVREGTYRILEPFTLGPEDSGTWRAPITYAAYPGESPVISGGRRVTDWEREGALWKAHVADWWAPGETISALWVNGEYRAPARTPNEGFSLTAGTLPVPEEMKDKKRPSPNGFHFKTGDIQAWDNLEDALVVALHSWDVSYHRIADIDEEDGVVRFTTSPNWPFENWGKEQRYYIEHLFEALDEPGEWYYNRQTGVLYYWPKKGERPDTAEVILPVASQLLKLEGDLEAGRLVEHVHLCGLRFHHTAFPLGPDGQNNAQAAYPVHGAVQASGARYCSLVDCEVAHISNYGVWFQYGCRDNRIAGNHLHDLGAGGVRIGDGADPATDHHVTQDNWVDNNWIHDGGTIFPAAVGVWIGRSSYNRVSHNEISDLFYTGVSVGWSWGYAPSSANHNLIEFNHIHHIGQGMLSDMGGIYTLGVAPGTILRHNLIHDVFSYTYGGWGIYPDEGSSDLLIENNVVYNTKTGGFHQHYGKENRVLNNVFAFAHEGQVIRTREEEHISLFFERNIVYFNNGRLLGSNWKNGHYRLDRNCYWDTSSEEIDFAGRTFDEWRDIGQDLNSIITDPLFRRAEAFDFRLASDSPALELGFQPIDLRDVGLYGSKEWMNAPKKLKHPPSELPKPSSQTED